MAITAVQEIATVTADGVTAITKAYTSNVATGNLLVVTCGRFNATQVAFTAADCTLSAGTATVGTITVDTNAQATPTEAIESAVWSTPVTAGGSATIRIAGSTGAYFELNVNEYSGVDVSASRVSGTPTTGTTNTAGVSPATASGVTTSGDALFIGAVAVDYAGASLSPVAGNSFTLIGSSTNGTLHQCGASIRKNVTGGSTESLSVSMATTSQNGWCACLVAYKAAAATTASGAPTLINAMRPTASRVIGRAAMVLRSVRPPQAAPVSGTVFTANFSGGVTPTGALVKAAAAAKAGTVTSTGTIAKLIAAAKAGSVTSSGSAAKAAAVAKAGNVTSTGAATKQANKAFAGSVTSSGVLSLVRAVLIALAGSVTSTGTLTKSALKSLAGACTSSGTIAKQAAKALAGSITSSGALAKLAKLAKAGSVTSSGVLSTTKVALLALAGSVTSSGTLARSALKGFVGACTSAGSLAKANAKGLAGSVASSGALAKLIRRAFAGAVTATGTFSKVFQSGADLVIGIIGTFIVPAIRVLFTRSEPTVTASDPAPDFDTLNASPAVTFRAADPALPSDDIAAPITLHEPSSEE